MPDKAKKLSGHWVEILVAEDENRREVARILKSKNIILEDDEQLKTALFKWLETAHKLRVVSGR